MSLVLITGANGFIGSGLSDALAGNEHQLRTTVRYGDSFHDSAVQNQIVVGDIGFGTLWNTALKDVDCVVHLAGRVHIMAERVSDPLTAFRSVNVDGTINLARQAVDMGVKRFIYMSSIKVNGETTNPGECFNADDSPLPIGSYALSKYEAEQALLKLSSETAMELVIIRSPLIYGPGVKANFYNMMHWICKGVPLPFGAIHNKRSLIALDNLVDLIITCIEHPAAANQIFLASDGEDLSTTELMSRLGIALNSSLYLFSIRKRVLQLCLKLIGKGDTAQKICSSLQVDISKARNVLGWLPPVSVNEAIVKTARYYLREKENK